MILCWSAKGGSGTTVVACALALGAGHPVTLVDLGGDCPTALGLPEPSTPGVSEWLASPVSGPEALLRLTIAVDGVVRLIPRGGAAITNDRWTELLAALAGDVVIDAGCGSPPPQLHDAAEHSLLVTRPCYLALRHAARVAVQPTGVVVVREPGRALRASDIEHAIGAPVVAELAFDPAVARAVDAGLLTTRLPRSLAIKLRPAA